MQVTNIRQWKGKIELTYQYYTNKEFMDIETGEKVKGTFIPDDTGATVSIKATEKQQEFYNTKQEKSEFERITGGFTRMAVDTLIQLHKDERFTDVEKVRIMFLSTYTSYEESGRFLRFGNNKLILKSHLKNLLDMKNEKKFYEFYNKLVDAGIIIEEAINKNEIRLKWDSQYGFKGDSKKHGVKSAETVKGYDKQIQQLYLEEDSKGKKINSPKSLYILYMMLPFLHKESSILCRYPNKEIEEAEPLDISELTDMFGYPKPYRLKNRLLDCKLLGTNVFVLGNGKRATTNKTYSYVVVNPFVASRSPKKPNDSLLGLFPDTAQAIEKYKDEQRLKH